MTNQESIDIIKTAIAQVEWDYPMEYAAAFDMAIKALENGWISVKNRLPPMYHMVLITGKNSAGGSFGVIKGSYDGDKGQWYRDDIGQYVDSRGDIVTHWMSLPEPPKEGADCSKAPAMHGRWIKMTGMLPPEYHGHYCCSECGWHMKGIRNSWTREEEFLYCPHCGVKMEANDEQNHDANVSIND